MEIIAVPAIVSLVFSILTIYKKIVMHLSADRHGKLNPLSDTHKEQLLNIIPIIGGIIGIIAGIICYFAFPIIIPVDDIITACLIGGASGLSATGCNQIFKQLHKFGIVVKEQEKDKQDNQNDKDKGENND